MIYIIFVVSIAFHELSHILVGMFFGYKIKRFVFFPLGAFIEFNEYPKSKKQSIKNILIYLAGPIANFVIGFVFYIYKINADVVYTNLILAIFNLLPMQPLDGGKILREILLLFCNNKKSNIYTYNISHIFLCIITLFYSFFIIKIQNLSLFIIIIYLWYIDFREYKRIQTIIRVYKVIEKSNI